MMITAATHSSSGTCARQKGNSAAVHLCGLAEIEQQALHVLGSVACSTAHCLNVSS
jgi:hypothetical protein